MIICDNKALLRDFVKSDIKKRIYWETEKIEWKQWDTPWEYENLTEEQKKKILIN